MPQFICCSIKLFYSDTHTHTHTHMGPVSILNMTVVCELLSLLLLLLLVRTMVIVWWWRWWLRWGWIWSRTLDDGRTLGGRRNVIILSLKLCVGCSSFPRDLQQVSVFPEVAVKSDPPTLVAVVADVRALNRYVPQSSTQLPITHRTAVNSTARAGDFLQ